MHSSPSKRARPRFPSSSAAAGKYSSAEARLPQSRETRRLTPVLIISVFLALLLFLVLPGGEPEQTRAVHLGEWSVDYVGANIQLCETVGIDSCFASHVVLYAIY